jgi:hypothetical protein
MLLFWILSKILTFCDPQQLTYRPGCLAPRELRRTICTERRREITPTPPWSWTRTRRCSRTYTRPSVPTASLVLVTRESCRRRLFKIEMPIRLRSRPCAKLGNYDFFLHRINIKRWQKHILPLYLVLIQKKNIYIYAMSKIWTGKHSEEVTSIQSNCVNNLRVYFLFIFVLCSYTCLRIYHAIRVEYLRVGVLFSY